MKTDIIIKQLENGCFDVHYGELSTEDVTFEEMLGVVTQLTIPEKKHCLGYLKSQEVHDAFRNRNNFKNSDNNGKDI